MADPDRPANIRYVWARQIQVRFAPIGHHEASVQKRGLTKATPCPAIAALLMIGGAVSHLPEQTADAKMVEPGLCQMRRVQPAVQQPA
jgi:hypothetical protein